MVGGDEVVFLCAWIRCADGETTLHVLARVDGAVCGTVSLLLPECEGGGVARLYQMGVRAEQRGRGVGRALIVEALRLCAEAGMHKVHLHARHYAVPFYQACGFVENTATPRFVEIGMEHAEMECLLPPGAAGDAATGPRGC